MKNPPGGRVGVRGALRRIRSRMRMGTAGLSLNRTVGLVLDFTQDSVGAWNQDGCAARTTAAAAPRRAAGEALPSATPKVRTPAARNWSWAATSLGYARPAAAAKRSK